MHKNYDFSLFHKLKQWTIKLFLFSLTISLSLTLKAQLYDVTLPQQCNQSNPGTNEVLLFPNNMGNATGDATLTIESIGDIAAGGTSTENLDYYDENNTLIGQTGSAGNCNVDVFTYTMPLADVLAFSADMVITVTVIPRSGVNTSQCSAAIGTAAYCSTGRLQYAFSTGPNDASVNQLVNPGVACPGVQDFEVTVFNSGTNVLTSFNVSGTIDNGTTVTNFGPIAISSTVLFSANSMNVILGNYNFVDGVQYDLKAWTSMPNGVADTVNNNDTLNANYSASLSGTYTVGSGMDFPTLVDAANVLNTFGMCGPVVLDVAPGTYTGQVELKSIAGNSSTNTITINGHGATLSAAGIAGDPAALRLDSVSYVTIDSLNIVGTDATYGWGIHLMNNADHNTITNCNIDLTALTSTSAANGVGIALSGSKTSPTTGGDNANFCVFRNNKIKGGSTGLYYGIVQYGLTGALGVVGNQFIDNVLEDIYLYNIYSVYSDGAVIRGNDVSRANKITVSTFYGVVLSTGCVGSIVENNRIHNTHDNASSLTGTCYVLYVTGADASSSAPNIFRNNMVYNINGTGTLYAIYNSSSDYALFHNNTISLDHTAATAGNTRGVYQTGAATGIEFKNNIFSITRGGSGIKYGLYFNTNTSTITSDNNVIYVNSAGSGAQSIGRWSGTDYGTFAGWQTANSGAFDALSDSTSPEFLELATDNYQPNSYTADNLGLPIAGVTTDIFGNPRSVTTPDPGAIEFSHVPSNDSCHQAIAVTAGIYVGTTAGATTDNAPTCIVGNSASNGVWFSYTAAGDYLSVSLCNSNFDTRLRIFSGACGALVCEDGNEDFCSTRSEAGVCTESGTTYYILVYGNGSAGGEFEMNVSEIPVQQAVITPSATDFCPGDTVTLSANTAAGYLWSDVAMSTTQDIDVTVAGAYYVVNTDTNGCIDTSASVTISEYVVVPPVVTNIGDVDFCDGDSVILSSDPATSYLWNDTAMSTSQNISINTSGDFYVYAVDGNGCGSYSDTISTTVLPLPTVNIGDDRTMCNIETIVLDAGAGLSTYFWSTGDTSQTIDFTGAPGLHTISVIVTDGNGCENTDEIQITVDDCTGIEENNSNTNISVYPNPGTGVFYLTTTGFNGESYMLRIADFTGKTVHNEVLPNTNAAQPVDLSHLSNGIYLMTLTDNDQINTIKLVIQ